MAFVGTFFAATGRLAVRFRWVIVLAWAAGAAAAMALLPSLSSVTQSDNTSFLPASAPSEQAAQLASPLQEAALTAVTVVAARSSGALTGPDEALVDRQGPEGSALGHGAGRHRTAAITCSRGPQKRKGGGEERPPTQERAPPDPLGHTALLNPP